MLKIIFLLHSLKIGGGNRVIIELSNKLVEKGIDVDIIYSNNSKEGNTFYLSNKINLIYVGNYKKNNFLKLINLFKIFRYVNTNYYKKKIILTDPLMSIFSFLLVKKNEVFRFIQADDYKIFDDLLVLKNKYALRLYKALIRISYSYKSINFLFNSKYTYEKFVETSKKNDIKYKLVHPAVNHLVFHNMNIRENNKFNICIIARKHPLKGFIDFLVAYKNIKSKIKIDNVFIISHDDLSAFDIQDTFLIRPKSDNEIAEYMNKAHVFISTSWWEGFGLPPLEAMACGCAVILTNAGGVNEYAVPYKNSLMYEAKDVKKLGECIVQLSNNKLLCEKLSKQAEIDSMNFSWNKSVNQLLETLEIYS